MAITIDQMYQLRLKLQNLAIWEVETSDNIVDVMAFKYHTNDHGDTLSPSLREANALWDEGQSRPPGYIVAAAIKRGADAAVSVMVSNEWYAANYVQFNKKKAEWEQTL